MLASSSPRGNLKSGSEAIVGRSHPCQENAMSPLPDEINRTPESSAKKGISRRRFSAMLFSIAGLPLLDWQQELLLGIVPEEPDAYPIIPPPASYPLYEETLSRVLPAKGFQSRIALKDSILRLVEHGVIDRGKFFMTYGQNNYPAEFANILSQPSHREILLTTANANYYVNLLWPIGLATRMAANAESPLVGESVDGFASTGGWTLGVAASGGSYFNQFSVVTLTEEQEARVVRIAKSTYRPCCNNSTFFQDCNHGSALLGVLQLGASQGLSDDEIYREALAFNSFWFPAYYLRTALFFKLVRNTEWAEVDPRVLLGRDYSAGGPWQENVASRVDAIPGLIPRAPGGGAGCGV